MINCIQAVFLLVYKVTRSKWLFLYKPERIFYSVFINSVTFYSEDFKKHNLIFFCCLMNL